MQTAAVYQRWLPAASLAFLDEVHFITTASLRPQGW